MRSASVDLPWSMCAMMQKLRMSAGSVAPGCGTFVALGLLSAVRRRGRASSHAARASPNRRRLDRAQVRVPRGRGDLPDVRLHPGLRERPGVRGRLPTLREGSLGEGPAGLRRLLPRGGTQAGSASAERPVPPAAVAPRRRLGGPRHRVRRRAHAATAMDRVRSRRGPGRVGTRRGRADPASRRARPRHRGGRLGRRSCRGGASSASPTTASTPTTWPGREALARRFAEVVRGDTLVHTDIRYDNLLIDSTGGR